MGTPLALLDVGTHMTFKEEAMDTTAKFKGSRAAGPQSRELRVLLAEDDAAQREAIAAYAADVAGTPTDLDEQLEATSLEHWREKRPVKQRRRRKR